jgi:hypothetical protein
MAYISNDALILSFAAYEKSTFRFWIISLQSSNLIFTLNYRSKIIGSLIS